MADNSIQTADAVITVFQQRWDQAQQALTCEEAISGLEQGKVLYLPELDFKLTAEESLRLNENVVQPGRKNISYRASQAKLVGVASDHDKAVIAGLMARYYQAANSLVANLLPHYQQALHTPMNTLRLHPVSSWGNKNSWRKDDSRLHVDAFPSRPIQGQRILRIFTNINPLGEDRVWRVGENFSDIADRFLPECRKYHPHFCKLLHRVGITKSLRTHYDHLMLGLHDAMKASQHYQQTGRQLVLRFPPSSSWICYSDQTPHAAMSGQFMLEQTFLLSVDDMLDPDQSPLRQLERKLGRRLLVSDSH